MKNYDFVVVGAGICGSMIAYYLNRVGTVLIIDDCKNKSASLSAGAFISPILGKENRYKNFVELSTNYALEFYKSNFDNIIDNCGTIKLCDNEKDFELMKSYDTKSLLLPKQYNIKRLKKLGISSKIDGFLFDVGSIIKPNELLEELQKNIDIKNIDIKNIVHKNDTFIVGDVKTDKLILANGYRKSIIDEPYINTRAVYGNALKIKTDKKLEFNISKKIYISKNQDGYIKIGATHHREIKELENQKEIDSEELLSSMNQIVEIPDYEVCDISGGYRSCSIDYFPMVGNIIDSSATIKKFPSLINGTKIDPDKFVKHKNIFMINGVGGRGFLFAPFIANELAKHITENKKIDNNISLDRLFIKWARKNRANLLRRDCEHI